MKTFRLDAALELWDGLCNELGATDEERARALQYNDDMLVGLFDLYSLLNGLYQNGRVIREFIREPQDELGQRTVAELAFSGNPQEMTLAREYICWLAGG